ncbi:MAG: lamin tail domain-containing protein [Myxococcales bacterium]|nr:lamin tail domain-containing protein [Myxococcales bacterium]MCB9525068.1 lamin tail domain-containing protein [Myxococcales bacterium]
MSFRRLKLSRLSLSRIALAAVALLGCSEDEATTPPAGEQPGESVCVGKCDGLYAPVDDALYAVDLAKLNQIWPGARAAEKLSDFYTVEIKLPAGPSVLAPTHMFADEITVLPYHDGDGADVVDASGNPIVQGDRELAKAFPPGAIGYAIKHHRPERRVLDFGALMAGGGSAANALKEDLKLQDTHIELVVGVERPLGQSGEMVQGVITLNNPQNYQNGRFGNDHYSMVFVRPQFPAAAAGDALWYEDNIRTMMLAFNAVSAFPGDYNGGDPLAAFSPDKVREHVREMVYAIAGEGERQAEARAFFKAQANMIYCAELAHVSTSAGLLVPLNQAGLVDSGLVDQATFDRFAQYVQAHNDGIATPFTQLNGNTLAQYVTATMAPDALRPLSELTGETDRLAFRPQTMAEIVEGFLRTHIPRSDPRLGGEALAPLQAAVLAAMKPGLLEAMGMDDALYQSMIRNAQDRIASLQEDLADPEISEARQISTQQAIDAEQAALADAQAQLAQLAAKRNIVEQVFAQVLTVVGTQHADYAAFREALAPVMAQARQLAGPRGGDGVGYFVPPSALHLVALGCQEDDRCGGLIGLEYVGHGIHLSAVTVNQPEPVNTDFPYIALYDIAPRPAQDYDQDGQVSARGDEYIVVANGGTAPGDASGWRIDDLVGTRYEFPAGTIIQPGHTLVIYGSDPNTRGGLGLNDNGDTLSLYNADGALVESLSYGRAGVDQVFRNAVFVPQQ